MSGWLYRHPHLATALMALAIALVIAGSVMIAGEPLGTGALALLAAPLLFALLEGASLLLRVPVVPALLSGSEAGPFPWGNSSGAGPWMGPDGGGGGGDGGGGG